MRVAALAVLVGCGFHPTTLDDGGSGSDDILPDVSVPKPSGVVHVPSNVTDAFTADGHVEFDNVIIDTRTGPMTAICSVTLPAGTSLSTSSQAGGGPELAILEVGDLTVSGVLRVVGARPLVIIARSTIVVNKIDASAERNQPGGGGRGPGAGTGAGSDGTSSSSADAGGGGGGFGTAGGDGQASDVATGRGGMIYGTNDLAQLDGGSGGGASSPTCAGIPAGAGGGAIQLYAGVSIRIDGMINANGGGGAGGKQCGNVGTSGAGGGAGGAIYLQSPMVLGSGLLLAQGGGGGGGTNVSTAEYGMDGSNGLLTIGAAPGGVATGTGIGGEDNTGCKGGWRDELPEVVDGLSGASSGNGGGGGGAVGRIVIKQAAIGSVSASPNAVVVP